MTFHGGNAVAVGEQKKGSQNFFHVVVLFVNKISFPGWISATNHINQYRSDLGSQASINYWLFFTFLKTKWIISRLRV